MTAESFLPTRLLVLQRGETRNFLATSGMVLVCIEGRVRRSEPIRGYDEPWPYIVDVAMGQGESYVCEQAVPVQVCAESQARLLCLRPASRWRVLARRLLRAGAKYAMISNIRRGVEQSGSSSGS